MTPFNPLNSEHRAIVIGAMAAADALGAGRITAAREQLEMNDISTPDSDLLSASVYAWGKSL